MSEKQKQILLITAFLTGVAIIGFTSRIEAYDDISSNNIVSINHIGRNGNSVSDRETEINPLCDLDAVICPNEETETASWYDYKLNGTEWSKNHRTCASRDLPRYSTAIVTNLENGKKVECFVNDYGPESWTGREIES
jgi:rare lipoprotein A (peptidoglycan hydrolase)